MKKMHFLFVFTLLSLFASSCGSNSQKEAPPAFTVDDTKNTKEAPGESVYKRTCITCHQAMGQGIPDLYPPLAKSDFLADKEKVILQVLKGHSGEMTVNGKKYNNTMPPQQLNDQETADVLTYVYSSFGNSGGAVTADEVKAARAKQ